ncbi:MAG: alpha/beta hydrolase [Actinomycetaceae bacterium]|nr:alpha/beta hydrolase [Actinomycetaceae bacterium]
MTRPIDNPPQFHGYPLEHGPRTGETITFIHGGNMAGWTWDDQVQGLSGRHILTPDMPGYGIHADHPLKSMRASADFLADIIRTHAVDGRSHIVGLSMGGFIATHLVAAYPDLVHSCIISGSALCGYSRKDYRHGALTLPLWTRRWFWSLQARTFGIANEDKALFVDTCTAPSDLTNRRLGEEIRRNHLQEMTFAFDRPFLAVAAEYDLPSISFSFEPLRNRLPHLHTWIAPGVHHAWCSENPSLFTQMVATFCDTGQWPAQLSDQ